MKNINIFKRVYFKLKKLAKTLTPKGIKNFLKKHFYNIFKYGMIIIGALFLWFVISVENKPFTDSFEDAVSDIGEHVGTDMKNYVEKGGQVIQDEGESHLNQTWRQIKEAFWSEFKLYQDETTVKEKEDKTVEQEETKETVTSKKDIGNDLDFIIINDNIPDLSTDDFYTAEGTIEPFQIYSELDKYGRSGEAYVLLSKADMPEYERGSISMVKPAGWKLINTKNTWGITLPDNSFYLYNRCHIIGFQLTGIDSDHTEKNLLEKNLFTGTRYLNIGEMLNIENKIAKYLRKSSKNYVLYKVTPLYEGADLLPYAVQLQALSIDNSIKINETVFNIQRLNKGKIEINYNNGEAAYIEG